jgi:hypothetical protein
MDYFATGDQGTRVHAALLRSGFVTGPRDTPPSKAPTDREDDLDRQEIEDELDEGIEGSFPASDPPSIISPKRPPDRGFEPKESEAE